MKRLLWLEPVAKTNGWELLDVSDGKFYGQFVPTCTNTLCAFKLCRIKTMVFIEKELKYYAVETPDNRERFIHNWEIKPVKSKLPYKKWDTSTKISTIITHGNESAKVICRDMEIYSDRGYLGKINEPGIHIHVYEALGIRLRKDKKGQWFQVVTKDVTNKFGAVIGREDIFVQKPTLYLCTKSKNGLPDTRIPFDFFAGALT